MLQFPTRCLSSIMISALTYTIKENNISSERPYWIYLKQWMKQAHNILSYAISFTSMLAYGQSLNTKATI